MTTDNNGIQRALGRIEGLLQGIDVRIGINSTRLASLEAGQMATNRDMTLLKIQLEQMRGNGTGRVGLYRPQVIAAAGSGVGFGGAIIYAIGKLTAWW